MAPGRGAAPLAVVALVAASVSLAAMVGAAGEALELNATTSTTSTTTTTTTTTTADNTTSSTTTTTTTTTTTSTTVTETYSTTTTTWDPFKAAPFCGEELLSAVLAGRKSEVQRYTLLDQDLNCRTDYEYLLELVLRRGQREMSEFIVESLPAGSNHTTERNETGATPLLMAADKGYTLVVAQLLRLSVNASVRDNAGHNALHLAAPWPLTVEQLLEMLPRSVARELLYQRDDEGTQPLHRALLRAASTEAATASGLAILAGAERAVLPEGTELAKDTPVEFVAALRSLVNEAGPGENRPVHLTGDVELLGELQRFGAQFDAETVNEAGATPFHTVASSVGSASSGALQLVARAMDISFSLLASAEEEEEEEDGDERRRRRLTAASMDTLDAFGRTALHYAAGGGDPSNIVWLIDRGADPDVKDVNGDTPLAYGLRQDNREIIEAFSAYGGTPLSALARVGRLDIIEDMVRQSQNDGLGLDIEATDPRTGRTALFEAAQGGQHEIMSLLIGLGANVAATDILGYSVLAAAAQFHQPTSMRILIDFGASVGQRLANGSTALHAASAAGCGPCIEVLVLEHGFSPDFRDSKGRAPLHVCGSAEAAEALLSTGATASLRMPGVGLMPAHVAAFEGEAEVLEVLLVRRKGGEEESETEANAEVVDGGAVSARVATTGDTPLHLAAASGRLETIRLLLRWCASTEVANNEGDTPLTYAATDEARAAIRDAQNLADRCTCDCGAFSPGPRFATSSWRPGCVGVVRCFLPNFGGGEEEVRCSRRTAGAETTTTTTTTTTGTLAQAGSEGGAADDAEADGGATGEWTPRAPKLMCIAPPVSSAFPRRGSEVSVAAALAAALAAAAAAQAVDSF